MSWTLNDGSNSDGCEYGFYGYSGILNTHHALCSIDPEKEYCSIERCPMAKKKCPECGGFKKIKFKIPGDTLTFLFDTDEIVEYDCPTCGGTGEVEEKDGCHKKTT